MKLVIRYLLFLVFIAVGLELQAQKTFQPKATQFDWKGIVYRKERAFEARLHTHGGLIGMNFGEIKTYYKTNYFHISLGYLKDPRESRQNRNLSFSFPERSKSFAFGKQNSVINLRGGLGSKRFLSEKAKRKGIAIGYDYQVGPSIAILKPYYLELLYSVENGGVTDRVLRTERYTPENAEKFTTYNDVFGGAGYFTGFGELTVVPGIQAQLGLFFSMGAFDKYVKALELGMMVDVYSKKLPIMIETEEISNKPYFFNFYIKFLLGKRSN
ncbi:MAG: hypothetical protein P1U56_18095 [Saprospiraceae bacterium]|nr:hypothetical protein [Saprospiraceae bacterium]